jgi:serine/threonine protein kinase
MYRLVQIWTCLLTLAGELEESLGVSNIRGHHLIGKVIGGCLLEEVLGYGGSSAVFLAQQYEPLRKVAVKVFLPRTSMNVQMQKDFYRRFLHEAEAATELNHTHILSLYAYGEQDGLPYITMPYMPGGTLYQHVAQHGPLSLKEAQFYLEQIAAALDYAHQHGCVHCDVKPANILLDASGCGMLSDFGIARAMRPDPPVAQQTQKTEDILLGTPNYISPEQAMGQTLDGRSDIYSLGVTLFFLLTGRPPFHADSSIAMALLHIHAPAPSLTSLCADIPPQVDRVVRTALAKSPVNRYQSAGEFSAAFARAVSAPNTVGQTRIIAKPARATVKGPASVGSRVFRPAPMAIATVFLLLVTLGAGLTVNQLTSHVARGTTPVRATVPDSIDSNILADRLASNQNDWPASSTFFFTDGQYHIENKSARNVALALYAGHDFANLNLSVTMNELHGQRDGDDYYGIVLRAAPDQSQYYIFEVVNWNGGQYAFIHYDGQYETLATGPAPSLHLQLGQSNTITVEAIGNTFTFFINGKAVGSPVTDSSPSALTTGEVGLYVEEQHAEVVFSNLAIKPLK